MLVVEHGAVELERRARAEREVGAVGHHQPRRAVGAGAHGFVAQQGVADIDLGAARSGDANDLVLDDGRLADALRMRRCCRDDGQRTDCQCRKNVVTPDHFPPYNPHRSSYRIARANHVV